MSSFALALLVNKIMLRNFLIVLLVLSGVFEIYQTVCAFLNPLWILSILQIPDSVGARTINHITAWFLLLVSVLILTCIQWVRRQKSEGLTLAIILGLWWVGIGIGIFVASGISTNLYADSLKGFAVSAVSFALMKKRKID